jgi:hypothetical protein
MVKKRQPRRERDEYPPEELTTQPGDLRTQLTQAIERLPAPDTSLLYLEEDAEQDEPVVVALTPPDFKRCQCEWPDQTAATFGPKPIIRCDQAPTVIAFQKRPRLEGSPTGMIALCDEHRVMIEHMYPGQCYFRTLTLDKKIGDIA